MSSDPGRHAGPTAPRLLAAALGLLLTAGLAGCGEDKPPAGYPYDRADDFDHAGCSGNGNFAATAAGTWHVYADFGDQRSSLAVRIDGTPGAYTGLLYGIEAVVEATDNDLFVRVEYQNESGVPRVRALDLCGVNADGEAVGHFVTCSGDVCDLAAVRAQRLVPLDEPELEGMRLLGSFNGTPDNPWTSGLTVNVRVADGIAYLARYQDGLRIVDVSDPALPRELARLPCEYPDSSEIYNDVKLVSGAEGQRWALMASNVVGVVVVDVTDPTRPAIVGHFGAEPNEISVAIHTLVVDGGKAYLANLSIGGLDIFDLSTLPEATRLGTFVFPNLDSEGGFVHDLHVEGDRAYLNYWNRGMAVVDVSDPAAPRTVGVFRDYGELTSHSVWVTTIGERRIAVHGDEQYGAHVHIVDVTEDSVDFLDVLAEYETRPEVSVHNIMAQGSLAYVTYYQDGLRVLDLSDPARPVKIAHFHSWLGTGSQDGLEFFEGAIGIDLDTASGTIYVADTNRGLFILALDP
jgi:hypothetical protein